MTSLCDLTGLINEAVDSLSAGNQKISTDERKNLGAACDRLKAVLETPVDVAFRIVFATHQMVAVRIAIEMGIFNELSRASDASVSIDHLAAKTGAEALLIARIMRNLAALKIVNEENNHKYSSYPVTQAFVDGSPLGDAVVHFHDVHANVLLKLPEYLVETKFRNPNDASDGPFQHAFGTSLHHFDWLKQNPRQLKAFNSLMTASRQDKGEDWFKFFPVEERLCRNKSLDAACPFLVDIGGGVGTDLTAFRNQYPGISGRLILQDLPEVVAAAQGLGWDIDAMSHDFFTPQPVMGARAYYLRSILHDWPDKEARMILQNVTSAMAAESTLLINEYILPDSRVSPLPAQLDLSMMAIFSSLERTREQWENLLESAGIVVVKIWTPPSMDVGQASLIEARTQTLA